MLILGVSQRDLIMHIHISILFQTFPHIGNYRVLSRIPCAPCWLSILYIVVCILEKAMATHCSTLAWKIPRTGKPDELPSMGSQSRTRLKWLSSSSVYMLIPTAYVILPSPFPFGSHKFVFSACESVCGL